MDVCCVKPKRVVTKTCKNGIDAIHARAGNQADVIVRHLPALKLHERGDSPLGLLTAVTDGCNLGALEVLEFLNYWFR